MTKAEKRAIKITELNEDLEEAKRIIRDFIYPPDMTAESRRNFIAKAARFAGVTVPIFTDSEEKKG